MKLGPKLRRIFSRLTESGRKFSVAVDYLKWLIFDPSKYKIIKTDNIDSLLFLLMNKEKGNVGGNFCVLGVLNHFKKEFPHVRVVILGDKNTINQFGHVPDIEMIEYKGESTLRYVRKQNFKAMVCYDMYENEIKDFMNIPYRVILASPTIWDIFKIRNSFFFTRKAFYVWGKTHMVDFTFKLLEVLGFKFKQKGLVFYSSKKEELKVDSFLKKNKIKRYVILHPGGKYMVETLQRGKWPPHLWPLDRYAAVANHFAKKGYKILVTGTKEENYLAEQINKLSGSKIISCCGKFSIRESAVLVKKSKLLIATDTSIVHIAYQVKAPIVDLIGPTCPEVIGPWPINSKRHSMLVDHGSCSRSMKKIECPEDIVCLENITVNDVISASEKKLKIN